MSFSQAGGNISCDSWLNVPTALSGVNAGNISIPGTSLTIEAVFNATGDTVETLVSKHQAEGDVNYYLATHFAQITTSNGFFVVSTNCPITRNKTYHVAMVYDGQTLKFYRDGFLLAQRSVTGTLAINSWPTIIGEYSYSVVVNNIYSATAFNGLINEVKFWNVARSQDQIRAGMYDTINNPENVAGLLAYYRFNSLRNLQGDVNFNAQLVGGATINATNNECTLVPDSCGTILNDSCNNWLRLPSVGSYVNVGKINVPGRKLTVEAMFNRTTPYSGGRLYAGDLVSKHNTPSDVNYLLRPNSAEITTSDGYFITPPVCDIELNKNYHVAMVYDDSLLKFYRNGVLMSQVRATGTLIQNNWNTRIGWYEPQGFNTNFVGFINEVRIWNVARTPEQLLPTIASPLPNPVLQPGLLAYYSFDNLLNKQGNATYNGTLSGAASINQTNTICGLSVDSCFAADVSCDSTWLNLPNNNSVVSIGDLDITGDQVTVEALINRTTPYLPGGAHDTEGDIVSKHNSFNDVNYLLRPNHAYVTTTNGFFGTPDICPIELNKTYHVALVYNGSKLIFYRDGYLMSEVNATGTMVQNNWNTRIGLYDPAFWRTQFIGYVNEVRIWNVARTQEQIRTNMKKVLKNPLATPGLKAYFNFSNLTNKQGNSTYNGFLLGAASINQSNPN